VVVIGFGVVDRAEGEQTGPKTSLFAKWVNQLTDSGPAVFVVVSILVTLLGGLVAGVIAPNVKNIGILGAVLTTMVVGMVAVAIGIGLSYRSLRQTKGNSVQAQQLRRLHDRAVERIGELQNERSGPIPEALLRPGQDS